MKIGVLLSGGVDSAVTALLLKQAGYEVVAITMVNWEQATAHQAAQMASFLGIAHYVLDLRTQFARGIIDYFCHTYQTGATPNPCVRCNSIIKFGMLLDYAMDLGCEKMATGHYAGPIIMPPPIYTPFAGGWMIQKTKAIFFTA